MSCACKVVQVLHAVHMLYTCCLHDVSMCSCNEYPELKGMATIVLLGMFIAAVLLGRNNDIIYR